MWCQSCRQDVPGIASAEARLCCARCGGVLTAERAASLSVESATAAAAAGTGAALRRPAFDPWEINQRLHHAQRVLQAVGRAAAGRPIHAQRLRLDLPLPAAGPPAPPAMGHDRNGVVISGVAWLALGIGTAAFACGAALAGWGYSTGRGELIGLGLPIALGGQAALGVGLALELMVARRGKRAAPPRADAADHLAELRRHLQLGRP